MAGQPLLTAAGVTDRGRVRRVNEDAFVSRPEAGVFVVCDGMGGAAAGETASRLAADTAASVLVTSGQSGGAMREAVRQANAAVYERARQDPQLEGMGTTLVALRLEEPAACVAHVGDSRCYRWRDGLLHRLTQDHSLVEEQVRIGRMTREQARRSPMQNVITRAVGTRSEVVADVQELPLQRGDVFLLASDGLTRELSDAALSAILASCGDDLQAACERMVADANAAGGRDNITCILVRVEV
jgi:PPM family protein phosphatase